MYKILAIIPGVPLKKDDRIAEDLIIECNTLIMKKQLFNVNPLINNLRSIDAVRQQNDCVNVYSFSKRNSIHSFIKSGLRIRSLTRTKNVDLVYSFWGGPASLVTVMFSRKPVFLTLLGSDVLGSYDAKHRKNLKGFFITVFTKMACIKARGVMVMSEEMKKKLSNKVQKKTIVVPECIDLDLFKPMDKLFCKKYLKLPSRSKIIIFFPGRGRVVKNLNLALDIVNKISEKYPDVLLVQVENIKNTELVYYYNAADLLLVTSLHEGSNNTIKEALACNCAVVSSNTGDAASRLKGIEGCFVIDNYDVNEYVEKVSFILSGSDVVNSRSTLVPLTPKNTANRVTDFFKQQML